MNIEALERQTGVYGTVNEGDVVTVGDSLGAELVAGGAFKETTKSPDTATPEEVSERNESGLDTDAVSVDGTNREILNDEGRKLHESGEQASAEAQARVEAGVTADLDQEPVSEGDSDVRKKKKA